MLLKRIKSLWKLSAEEKPVFTLYEPLDVPDTGDLMKAKPKQKMAVIIKKEPDIMDQIDAN